MTTSSTEPEFDQHSSNRHGATHTRVNSEGVDNVIETPVSNELGKREGGRAGLMRHVFTASVIVLFVGGSVIAIDWWIVPPGRNWSALWQDESIERDSRRQDHWADWYANRPTPTQSPIPHFNEYEPGPWALAFNGQDSFVYFADPGPIPNCLTVEMIATLKRSNGGTLIRWIHDDESVAITIDLNGMLQVERVRHPMQDRFGWSKPAVEHAIAEVPLEEPLHVVAQWDGDDHQLFVNGQPLLTRPVYTNSFRGKSSGVFVGGVPRSEVHESSHLSPFAAALIHEFRITRGLRYRDGFHLPSKLTREVADAEQQVLLFGDFREKHESNALADPQLLSRTIRNANWVQQP